MRDVVAIRDRWRQQAAHRALSLRLMTVGFPITLAEALDGAAAPNPVLTRWAREGLQTGRIFKTAQAEQLAQGKSLEEIAASTGLPTTASERNPGDLTSSVLAVLAWAGFEEDE